MSEQDEQEAMLDEEQARESTTRLRLLDTELSWETPFGGFEIGDPFDNSVAAILDLYRTEYENEKFKPYIDMLIMLEMNDRGLPPNDPGKPVNTAAVFGKTGQSYAWEDTSIGGGPVINPIWQFGIDDDIVPPSNVIAGSKQTWFYKEGMGRVYTDMYYANQKIVWLTFGMPKYSTLRYYMKTAVDTRLARLANNANMSMSQKVGSIVGTGFALAIMFPVVIAVGLVKLFDTMGAFVFGRVNTYYELRPAMHRYYRVVNTILATLCVHLDLTVGALEEEGAIELTKDDAGSPTPHPVFGDKFKPLVAPEGASQEEQDMIEAQNKLLLEDYAHLQDMHNPFTRDEFKTLTDGESAVPEILQKGTDIIAVMNRRHDRRDEIRKELGLRTVTDEKSLKLKEDEYAAAYNLDENDKTGLAKAHEQWISAVIAMETSIGNVVKAAATNMVGKASELLVKAGADKDQLEKFADDVKERYAQASELLEAAVNSVAVKVDDKFHKIMRTALGEMMYIGIRIESGTSSSESLSNSTAESAIASKLKAATASSRSRSFSFAGGSTGVPFVDALAAGGAAAISKAGDILGISGITDALVRGSGFLDIPEVWSDSSFSKSYSFDIELRSKYGDTVSIYQSIYIPLAMILSGSFPLGIGKNAYTSPFIAQAYCKGLFSVPLGIIDSVSIKRGAPEHGWSVDGLPTVVSISVSIKDMSPMVFLTMTDAGLMEPFRNNTNMQNYLATLAGVELYDLTSKREMFLRKRKITMLLWRKNYFNSTALNHRIGSSTIVRKFASFSARGVWHPAE